MTDTKIICTTSKRTHIHIRTYAGHPPLEFGHVGLDLLLSSGTLTKPPRHNTRRSRVVKTRPEDQARPDASRVVRWSLENFHLHRRFPRSPVLLPHHERGPPAEPRRAPGRRPRVAVEDPVAVRLERGGLGRGGGGGETRMRAWGRGRSTVR